MNPSYNSGQNSAGAKPGVIASGASNTPVSGGATPAGPIPNAPIVSRQPTGGRPAGSGIVLNNSGFADSNFGPSRKWLIVGGVVIGVLVVVIIIVVVIMNNRNSNNNASSRTPLQNMTNYMIYGNVETDGNLSEIKVDGTAFYQAATNLNYDEQKDFFNNAMGYVGAMNDSNLINDTTTLKYLAAITYTDMLQKLYLSDGAQGLQEYNDEMESTNLQDEQGYAGTFRMAESLVSKYSDYYKKFADAGCVSDNEFNDECINTLATYSDDVMSLQTDILRLKGNLRVAISGLMNGIMAQILRLNGMEYNG